MFRRSTSIKLFNLFGFRIGADASWFLVLFLMIYLLSRPFRVTLHSSDGVAYMTTVISVLLLFASLIAHELGHALVARRQGIEVKQIDLFLFGGLTKMSRDAATPGEDFKVSAAGPLATLAVILVCLGVDLAIVGSHRLLHAIVLDTRHPDHPGPAVAQLAGPDERPAADLQPDPRLSPRRRPDRPLDRLADHRRQAPGHACLGPAGPGVRPGDGGRRPVDDALAAAASPACGCSCSPTSSTSRRAAAIVQSALNERIEGVRVSDIMDTHPVAIPALTPVGQALDEYFLRYRWSWFPVVEEDGRLAGIARQERTQASVDGGEGWLTMGAVLEPGAAAWRVREDRPISEVLSSESLGQLGAVMAVDADGILRGVVTVEQVRRALRSAFGGTAA